MCRVRKLKNLLTVHWIGSRTTRESFVKINQHYVFVMASQVMSDAILRISTPQRWGNASIYFLSLTCTCMCWTQTTSIFVPNSKNCTVNDRTSNDVSSPPPPPTQFSVQQFLFTCYIVQAFFLRNTFASKQQSKTMYPFVKLCTCSPFAVSCVCQG